MPANMTIELQDLRFHAFHGLYPEERKTGNQFRVELQAVYCPTEELITRIDDTVNYATLFSIVQRYMQQPHDLLETLAMKITAAIHTAFPVITSVRISIYKLQPPIAGFNGSVGITYQQDFK